MPSFNATMGTGGRTVELLPDVHVGVVVDTGEGLAVPVLRHVDRRGVLDIAEELAALAAELRAGGRVPTSSKGGAGFTVSDYSGFGERWVAPLVRSPEVACLGVGAVEEEVVAVDGRPVVRAGLPLVLSADHRLLDARQMAAFRRLVGELLEDPARLVDAGD
jgi:pyruvate dehydrogenase E2 component (dihydrolipoamide acetyltransferase)